MTLLRVGSSVANKWPLSCRPFSLVGRNARLFSRPWAAECSRLCAGRATEPFLVRIENLRLRLAKHAQWFVHCGNLILLLAVNQTDMLNMRVMMVTASTMGMLYNLLQPKPLIPPAIWGLGFIGSHLFNIYVLIKEKAAITFSKDEETVYEETFMQFGFAPRQYKDILEQANAQWCNFSEGTFIFKRGDPMNHVHWLMEGEGHLISSTNDKIFTIQPGKGGWIGEFFDPNAKPESYTEEAWAKRKRPVSFKCTATQCRTLALDMRRVQEIMHGNARLKEFATRAEVSDLWGKLHRSLPEHRQQTYEAMIAVAASDGEIESHEVALLENFRSRHNLSDVVHLGALEKIGWTEQDWKARRKA